jgi:hypothetical protein
MRRSPWPWRANGALALLDRFSTRANGLLALVRAKEPSAVNGSTASAAPAARRCPASAHIPGRPAGVCHPSKRAGEGGSRGGASGIRYRFLGEELAEIKGHCRWWQARNGIAYSAHGPPLPSLVAGDLSMRLKLYPLGLLDRSGDVFALHRPASATPTAPQGIRRRNT